MMSKQNEDITENQKLMEEFINSWARFSIDHPELTLGEWLKTFSIMTALAMKMGDIGNENVSPALAQMSDVIHDVYQQADNHIQVSTIQ
jgi:hypothetical protein